MADLPSGSPPYYNQNLFSILVTLNEDFTDLDEEELPSSLSSTVSSEDDSFLSRDASWDHLSRSFSPILSSQGDGWPVVQQSLYNRDIQKNDVFRIEEHVLTEESSRFPVLYWYANALNSQEAASILVGTITEAITYAKASLSECESSELLDHYIADVTNGLMCQIYSWDNKFYKPEDVLLIADMIEDAKIQAGVLIDILNECAYGESIKTKTYWVLACQAFFKVRDVSFEEEDIQTKKILQKSTKVDAASRLRIVFRSQEGVNSSLAHLFIALYDVNKISNRQREAATLLLKYAVESNNISSFSQKARQLIASYDEGKILLFIKKVIRAAFYTKRPWASRLIDKHMKLYLN